jgi:hypothetical protein
MKQDSESWGMSLISLTLAMWLDSVHSFPYRSVCSNLDVGMDIGECGPNLLG